MAQRSAKDMLRSLPRFAEGGEAGESLEETQKRLDAQRELFKSLEQQKSQFDAYQTAKEINRIEQERYAELQADIEKNPYKNVDRSRYSIQKVIRAPTMVTMGDKVYTVGPPSGMISSTSGGVLPEEYRIVDKDGKQRQEDIVLQRRRVAGPAPSAFALEKPEFDAGGYQTALTDLEALQKQYADMLSRPTPKPASPPPPPPPAPTSVQEPVLPPQNLPPVVASVEPAARVDRGPRNIRAAQAAANLTPGVGVDLGFGYFDRLGNYIPAAKIVPIEEDMTNIPVADTVRPVESGIRGGLSPIAQMSTPAADISSVYNLRPMDPMGDLSLPENRNLMPGVGVDTSQGYYDRLGNFIAAPNLQPIGIGTTPVFGYREGGEVDAFIQRANGGSASSSGVRRLKMSGYQAGGDVSPAMMTPEQLDEFNRNLQRELDEENRRFEKSGGPEFYSAIRPAMEDINERVKQTLELYRMGRATEADVQKLLPSLSEYEIASQFGRTDTGGYRSRDIDAPSRDRLREFIEIQKPTIDAARPDMFPYEKYDPRGPRAQGRVLEMSKGGDVTDEMFLGTRPEDFPETSPVDKKAGELLRALSEGTRGFVGAEPIEPGSEAYRTGQALANMPAVGVVAGTVKGAGKAKDALKSIVDPARLFEEVEKIPRNQVIDDLRSAHIGGVGDFGDSDAKYYFSQIPGGKEYIKKSQQVAKKNLGDRFMGYRLMSKDQFEDLQAGDVGDLLSFTLDQNTAEALRNFVTNQKRTDLVVAEVPLTPKHIVAFGHSGEKEIIVDTGVGWSMDEFKQAAPLKKAQGGEVTNDEFIQEMMTGTRPEDETTSPGILPPEIRQAVDVPLDFANLLIRGTAAVPIGGAAGLYKGITGGKYGTQEGVKEADTEAARMMAKITGEPKTQAAKDVLEFIGGKAQEYKLDAALPQLLTLPSPGPGAASALMRSYELAETPPVGTLKLAGDKGVKPATPPTDQMGFYSPAEKAVMGLPQDKGTASQMLAQITKTQGVKPVELRATGLEDYLKGKGNEPVTKQEIQDFLTNNRVQVDEVVLGKGQTLSPEAKKLSGEALSRMEEVDEKLASYFEGVEEVAGQDPYSAFIMLRSSIGRRAAKGDQEALDELNAFNLPPEIKDLVLEFGRNKNEYIKYTSQARKMEKPKFDRYNTPGGQNAREIYLTLPGSGKRFEAPGAHSVSPEADTNRLAHIFLDERKDAKGDNVLFVQELQSDWAQTGRDKGFFDFGQKAELPEGTKVFEPGAPDSPGQTNQAFTVQIPRPVLGRNLFYGTTREEALANAQSFVAKPSLSAIPSAPFVTNTEDWVNLALKRVIKEAVDNDIDTVAFIKGEQAANKYSLSVVLDGIDVSPAGAKSNTSRSVDLKQKGGGIIPLFVNEKGVVETAAPRVSKEFIGKPLSEIIGKDMAEKVMSAKRKPGVGETVSFDVEDLVVGGKGMEGFYDNILPKTAEKLLKKLGGGKVEPVEVVKGAPSQMPFEANAFVNWMEQNHPGTSRSDAARAWGMGMDNNQFVKEFYEATKSDQYLGFKITPEMKEMVKTEGLPKFAAGGEVTDFIKRAA